MNRAVHGDVVVVEVFDESEWKAPTDEVVDQEGASSTITLLLFSSSDDCFLATLKNDNAEDSEEESDGDEFKLREETKALRSVHTKKGSAEKQPTGRVVGIIKRNWRAYVFCFTPVFSFLIMSVLPPVTCAISILPPFHLRLRLRSLPRLSLLSRFPDYSPAFDCVLVKLLHFLAKRFS